MSVSQEDLDSVREAQEQMMPEDAVLLRRHQVPDNRGGTTATYDNISDGVHTAARVGQPRELVALNLSAGQLRGKASAMLTIPVHLDSDHRPVRYLWEGDRVVVLGRTYQVVGDLSSVSYPTASRFLIAEV